MMKAYWTIVTNAGVQTQEPQHKYVTNSVPQEISIVLKPYSSHFCFVVYFFYLDSL